MLLENQAAPPADFDPEKADNNEDIERQWAVKSIQHMLTYWSILQKIRGSTLKLTKYDSEIYAAFKSHFPDFDLKARIDEEEMKSPAGKEKWRAFIKEFEDRVEDFNFGTMLRAESGKEYGEEDTIFAVRMQFYAVEIARNREGLNDWVWEAENPEKARKEREEKEKAS